MTTLDWLNGGGEMGQLIREKDWSKTSLGPITSWPANLRTTVSLCLSSSFPINIIWGPDHIQIYNEGYRDLCGAVHPKALGESYKTTWASAWPAIGQPFEDALSGKTTLLKNQPMILERNGFPEETFFTFSLSPIRDEKGEVVGLFHPVSETTPQMLVERRLELIRDLSARTSKATSIEESASLVSLSLSTAMSDIPYSFLYLLDKEQINATLYGQSGRSYGDHRFTRHITLSKYEYLAEIIKSKKLMVDSKARTIYFPITNLNTDKVIGIFISAISPSVPYDESYKSFHELLANTISISLNNAILFDEERQRVVKLEDIDRAKTTFFSNVSHEFRTPLTLILGSIEESFADKKNPLNDVQKKNHELTHRNALRLLKLVNTLLDFSRIEAGKSEGLLRPTNLPEQTRDLASTFRAAIEHAGIRFTVEMPEQKEPVYVDHVMWEKIVLNLLSNAYKFTFNGEIKVSLSLVDHYALLEVSDTGLGIPKAELPHLFKRFHRVEENKGRTHEGTGIGLNLVHELVKIHGGKIEVRSSVGEGTLFQIFIPRGHDHLDVKKVNSDLEHVSTGISSNAYVQEALRWTGVDSFSIAPEKNFTLNTPQILVVDDNADLRDYLGRILQPHYRVTLASDGLNAIKSIEKDMPDLIVTDVMMPNMDGFAFLEALRNEDKTKDIPVIFLSARAGEGSRIEGLNFGVNDYLEKPFSAGELLARIQTHLENNKFRNVVKLQMDDFFMQSPIPMVIYDGPEHIYAMANPVYEDLIGKKAVGKKISEVMSPKDLTLFLPILNEVYKTGIPFVGKHLPYKNKWIDLSYQPIFGVHGKSKGILAIVMDVTDQLKSVQVIEDKNQELIAERILRERFVDALSHDMRAPLTSAKIGAELLARKLDDPSQLNKINIMLSSLNRVDNMIKNMLDANQIKAGILPSLKFSECSLNSLISSTIKDLTMIFGERFEFSSCPDVLVPCDGAAFKRILENLLSNAVKYGSTQTPIVVSTKSEGPNAFVEIHNTGNPIDVSEQQIIFEPYQRTENALTGSQKGWGIGLSLVKTLVEAHAGSISVKSSKEEGTTFVISIPLKQNH